MVSADLVHTKGLDWIAVVIVEEGPHAGFQRPDAAVHASPGDMSRRASSYAKLAVTQLAAH